ncbi:MAG: SDR family NAD(P)-dependent oxidoreductase [Natronospirillum sp.]|uniref:SDR family NAD(P)-dependent oxidoreductase n=1 Tax=Natronospirillum sp. TaxID=2812955 RepID=UPI0025CFE9FE|nr:SDR family NAD(P)-dependent oxidoreductase [Natronospirillum sp.]MCH8550604.1 SDR family NAD(P)-dependent oxidoreductase [Natronospirillum sp.]
MGLSVWLVGASTGIGYHLARELAAELAPEAGHLFISARSADKLQALADDINKSFPKVSVTVLPLDITDAPARDSALQQIADTTGSLDWLVLNAGTCEYIDMDRDDNDLDMYDRVLDTNFHGPVRLFHAALPLLRKGRDPRLVGISSSVTFSPLPRAQAYGASKAAFTYWLGTMAADLKPLGIRVQVVSPGFVDTPLTRRNDFKMPFLLSAEDAGKRIRKGIRRQQAHIHFPKRFTLGLRLFGLLPLGWQYALNSKLSRNAAKAKSRSAD